MIKKLLSFVAITAFTVGSVMAQCTPDPQYTEPGIYPDSATGLDTSRVGEAYNQVITVVVPTDTTATFQGQTLDFEINYIRADSVNGLPTGYSFSCNPGNCEFQGGDNGCILLSGQAPTQGMIGVYSLKVYTTTNVTHPLLFPNGFDAQVDTVEDYSIIITEPIGVAEVLNSSKFEVAQNIPNPFSGITTITFTSPQVNEMELTVYNMLGKVVSHKEFLSEAGVNQYEFDATGLSQGVYMYTLSNGSKAITKRMVISNR